MVVLVLRRSQSIHDEKASLEELVEDVGGLGELDRSESLARLPEPSS